jgi:GAF domain-containing protein
MSDTGSYGDSFVTLTELIGESVPPEGTMLRVAQYAAEMSPQAGGAVLSEFQGGTARVTVGTSSLVKRAQEAQFELGEGPCLAALERRAVLISDSLVADPAWPRYAGRVRRLGLQSALVTPLVLHDTVVGVLAMYASGKAAFTERDGVIAQRYARPLAVIVRNARVLAQCRAELEQLHEALRIRPVIDQAVGILRSRTGESEAKTFERLRAASNAEHVKISELAARVVEDAVRGAVAKHEAD